NDAEEERGVLREMLPQWLTEPGLRPLVLAYDTAKPQHGGSGAYYILLRRKR
ncbi:MAG: Smr/MutS family protein, partial [Rickettsiales bacterium]|nr:Smr/MutS family protein [Rickettsiales bacterium]